MSEVRLGLALNLHFVFVELTLGVIGFLGLIQVLSLNSAAGITLQAVAFAIAVACWLWLVCSGRSPTSSDPSLRGQSIVSVKTVYFCVCAVLHFIALGAWIGYAVQFDGLDPINETTNVGAFLTRTLLHFLMLIELFAIVAVLVGDMRALQRRNKRMTRPQDTGPAEQE